MPFQDINLINRFFFMSNYLKFNTHNRKYLLKEMNILPKYIINRPKNRLVFSRKIFLETNLTKIIKEFFDEKKIEQQNIFDFDQTLKFLIKFPIENWKIKKTNFNNNTFSNLV